MKSRIPLAALLLCASVTSFGQIPEGPDWRIGADSGGSWVYYNRAKIVRPAGGRIRVWVQYVDSQSRKRETIDLYEYNCKSEMLRVLSQTKYSSDGTVLRSVNPKAPQWDFIIPDSVGERMFKVVCKGQKDYQHEMEDDAADSYRKGRTYEAEGYLDSALILYEHALSIFPEEPAYQKAAERVKSALEKRKQE